MQVKGCYAMPHKVVLLLSHAVCIQTGNSIIMSPMKACKPPGKLDNGQQDNCRLRVHKYTRTSLLSNTNEPIGWLDKSRVTDSKMDRIDLVDLCVNTLLLQRHPFNSLFFQDNLGKSAPERQNHSGFHWSKRWWGDSGISWTIRKSFSPHSKQITTRHESKYE